MTPQQFTAWREALGGRRFLLTVGSGIVNTALRIFDYIDVTAFVTLILATVATYIGARTYLDGRNNAGNQTNVDRPGAP